MLLLAADILLLKFLKKPNTPLPLSIRLFPNSPALAAILINPPASNLVAP